MFGTSEFVGPRTEVHLLDESYAWVPKLWDFTEYSSEEFRKSKVSGLEVSMGLPRFSSTLKEVGSFPTLFYFPF